MNECSEGDNPLRSCSRGTSVVAGWAGEHRDLHWTNELAGRHSKKGSLIYNLEDGDLRLPNNADDTQEISWIGAAETKWDVLILRDPFNLFASKLRWARGTNLSPDPEGFPALRDLWKAYAKEFLGETSYLPRRFNISYNEWFLSRRYRDGRASELGFVNRDVGLEEVAKWGPTTWGDSFDGLKYDGRAGEMKVLDRWREYAEDELYRSLMNDEETHDLSRRIFGEIPGTEALQIHRASALASAFE